MRCAAFAVGLLILSSGCLNTQTRLAALDAATVRLNERLADQSSTVEELQDAGLAVREEVRRLPDAMQADLEAARDAAKGITGGQAGGVGGAVLGAVLGAYHLWRDRRNGYRVAKGAAGKPQVPPTA